MTEKRRCRDLTMSNYASEVAPQNKRRKKDPSSSSSSESLSGLLHSLPDAVAISCLARISRFDLAALSLVSRSCRSLVISPELYQERSLMGYAQKFLYICLSMPPDPTPRWFILRPTLEAATGRTVNHAHPIPSFPCQPPEGSAVVALDWGIYVIGGLVNGKRTAGVLLLDCRSHEWHHVTSMRVARASAAARVVDGKIYVLGGCKDENPSDWGEVFDPKKQTWAALPITKPVLEEDLCPRPIMSLVHDSVVIKEKIYVVDSWNRSFYYLPSQGKWGRGNMDLKPTNCRDWCVIDKLIYSCGNDGVIYWCEPEELDRCDAVGVDWKDVRGLQMKQEGLYHSRVVHFGGKLARVWESYKMVNNISKKLEEVFPGAKLTNFGQNIVVFWDVLVGGRGHKRSEIWCAEISLERKRKGHIWGKVEWSDAILTVDPLPSRSKVLYSISVDV